MFFVTVTQLMGDTSSNPINIGEVPHEETAAGLVDRALLTVLSHAPILAASGTASKDIFGNQQIYLETTT